MSASERSERPARQADLPERPGALLEQIEHLGLDDELGAVVREGLRRIPATEQASIAADLDFAFRALEPAVKHLRGLGATGALSGGAGTVIQGEVTAFEDLTVDGQIVGKIDVQQNAVTIGSSGRVRALILARSVRISGEVIGNIFASERVDILDGGSLDGDVVSPRVAIAEGAHFRGSIDMQRGSAARSSARPMASAMAVRDERGWNAAADVKAISG